MIAIQFSTESQTTGPGKDRSDRVRRRRLASLMLTEMPGHGAVSGFRLHGLAVRGDEHRCHQAQRAKALSDDVRLHVAVIWWRRFSGYWTLSQMIRADVDIYIFYERCAQHVNFKFEVPLILNKLCGLATQAFCIFDAEKP